MPDILQTFLNWYLAPWRRIGRKEFGVALTVATLPALFIMIFGWGGSAGSFLGPLMDLASGGGNLEGALGTLSQMAQGTPVPVSHSVDWSGLVNGLCLLAMVPLSRMRLRDMGWFGWQELVLTVLFNISVVEGLLQSLTGYDLLPFGTLWGVLNFGGYAWLTLAKGKERQAVHERTTYDSTAAQVKRMDDEY